MTAIQSQSSTGVSEKMSSKEEILEKITERAAELYKTDASQYNAGTRFIEDLKAKSVNYVQIIAVLEEEFDIQIPFMEFRRKQTFGEAAEYVAGLAE
jgi:acyl carrier protein